MTMTNSNETTAPDSNDAAANPVDVMVSEHFSRSEFACTCGCGFDAVDIELLNVLEDLRNFSDSPVYITSGCRCQQNNESVGGSSNSMHTKGKAADIKTRFVLPELVYNYLDLKYPNYGVGLYESWVHIDVRDKKARWGKPNAG